MTTARTRAKRGPIDYIRKHSTSKVLWFRYQFPAPMGWKAYEKSLRTYDMKTARERAAPHLVQCVAWVKEYKSRNDESAERRPVAILDWLYPVGIHPLPDGGHVQAEQEVCYFVASNGRVVDSKPRLVRREVEGLSWTRAQYQAAVDDGHLGDGQILEHDCPGWRGEPIELLPGVTRLEDCRAPPDGGLIPDDKPIPRSRPRPCGDDTHLERYLKHRNITGYSADEARRSWTDFRMLTNGKPLKDCDRDDGRMLVDYYLARPKGNKRATVQKKIMYLNAMVRLAMNDPKSGIRFNPFVDIIPNIKDAVKREPIPEEDMAIVRGNLDRLKPEEKLLWMMCATTGMRRGEALSINREYVEKGVRYVIVGTKSDASHRRVPLPDAVLPLLPKPIKEPIFEEKWLTALGQKNLGRNVLRAIRRLGVTGMMRDIHALRHRAKDQLRAAECPPDMLDWICGHDKRTVSVDYGKGPPVRLMKRWIEEIGY